MRHPERERKNDGADDGNRSKCHKDRHTYFEIVDNDLKEAAEDIAVVFGDDRLFHVLVVAIPLLWLTVCC